MRVSLLKLSQSFTLNVALFATLRFVHCALLLVVCCGVRLAVVSLYFAKRKAAIV